VGVEALTVDVLAIAAAAAWLLVFGWCSVVTSRPALRAGTVDPGPGLTPAKPALVNLSVTRCRVNGAAYPATILDLAAGGYLTISDRVPGRLWCDVPASSPPETGLARSERLVLAGARALAGGRGAPFEALAESCASDVRGRWDPFERAVRAEGRRTGITRPRLSATARLLLYVGAGGVGVAAFAAVYGRAHSALWAPIVTAFLVFVVLACWAGSVGRQDRLTAQGAALGAWAARAAGDVTAAGDTAAPGGTAAGGTVGAGGPAAPGGMAAAWGMAGLAPAELGGLAWAVAAGAPVQVPGATPGLAAGVRPGRGRAGARTGISGQFTGTPRPSAAWSSFGGQWRLVRIGPAPFMRMHPAFWLVLGAWLALMAYVSSLLSGPAGLLAPAGLAVGSAAAAVGGARGLAARLARPAEASFQAQVIARWVEHSGTNDDDSYISCIAVDDGERSWSFDVSAEAFAQLALGDTVAVRASPRSGKLLGLVPDQGWANVAIRPDQDRAGAWPGWAGGAAVDEGPPAAPTGGPPATTTSDELGASAAGEPAAVTAGEPAATRAGEPTAATSEPGAPFAGAAAAATPGAGVGAAPPDGRWAQQDGGAAAPPPGVLLSANEVSAAVGRPVRGAGPAPGGASAVYRGEGITVIVTVADGILGSLTALARRRGQPLAGVGDEAWLLNGGRTAVLLVGGLTAKVSAGGSATRSLPPGALARLAATLAERLPHHVTLPGMQA
jgi:hypothetical protein